MNYIWKNMSQTHRIGKNWAEVLYAQEGYKIENSGWGDFKIKKNGIVKKIKVVANKTELWSVAKKYLKIKDDRYICYVYFQDGVEPEVYEVPVTKIINNSNLFVYYPHTNSKKSDPEYVVQYNDQAKILLEQYKKNKN